MALKLTQESVQVIIFLSQITNSMCPVHLSTTHSINLAKILHYGSLEKLDDDDKPTGEFVPVITFEGGETVELSDVENEVFRPIWDIYARLAADQFEALNAVMVRLDDTAVNSDASGGEVTV